LTLHLLTVQLIWSADIELRYIGWPFIIRVTRYSRNPGFKRYEIVAAHEGTRLHQAAATYSEAAQVAPDGLPQLLNSAAYFFGMGDLLREWNNFDAAEHHLMQGLNLAQGMMIVDADIVLIGYVALARLLQARGDRDGAMTMLLEP